ncbi:LuxR C-terminal-related transcriptional regulator [Vibrio amylolyticus]|uniref:LuxR C-terminal-related transcriptional regulator n=1 Tax=Vibrio amylolyticus TaxID=2847292 RepID=UPI00355453E0
METLERAKVTLLLEENIQSNLLKESLETDLPILIEITPFKQFYQLQISDLTSNDIIIFDFSSLGKSDFQMYSEVRMKKKLLCKEVLVNCPIDVESSKLFKWHNLVGVFYNDDNTTCLIKGIKKILDDEMWLSRRIAQDCIQHFRGTVKTKAQKTQKTHAKLTKREEQIIQSLASGSTNIQIADELCVSENTIKTHLHNIFKKINAKNRLQALLWASNNIELEENV